MAKELAALSVQELQQLLQLQQSKYQELVERRLRLLQEIVTLDGEISTVAGEAAPVARRRGRPPGSGANAAAALDGGGKTVRRKRKRAQNEKSLKDVLHDILAKSKKPLSTAELEEKVIATGYKTHSKNFRPVVYLNLYNNGDMFQNVDSKWQVATVAAEA